MAPYSGSQGPIPYSPSTPGYGMQSSYPGYYPDPYTASMMYGGAGRVLQGEAAVIRGVRQSHYTTYEQARLVREQLNQARLETKRKHSTWKCTSRRTP